jgi:aldehyde dehydrogenase (NAD+)
MTLSFDPNSIVLPRSHFIGGQMIPAEGAITMHRP